VDDGLRFVDLEEFVDEALLDEVALDEGDVVEAVDLASGVESLVDARDRRRTRRAVSSTHSVGRSCPRAALGRPSGPRFAVRRATRRSRHRQ